MSHITVYSTSPYVATHDNFLSDEECDHFIRISRDNLKRALVSTDKTGVISTGRTGKNTWVEHKHDKITYSVGERIAKIVGLPLENAEKFQVIYYGRSQEYRNHYDSWEHDYSEKTLRCMKYGGARLKTALVYLNDVEEGGGTSMTKLGITIQARKGRLLVFHNTLMDENGTHDRHPLSEHAGMPVIKGEKYAFNLWFKECNSRTLYSVYNPQYYAVQNDIERLDDKKDIYKISLTSQQDLVGKCDLKDNGYRRSGWIKKDEFPLTYKISNLVKIDTAFFENVNVIEYKPGSRHGRFHDAYDLNTEKGRKFTKDKGQRYFTVSLILGDNILYDFPELKVSTVCKYGDCLIYRNTLRNSEHRDDSMIHTITNNTDKPIYIANLYVRDFDMLFDEDVDLNEKDLNEKEDYIDTLDTVLDKFQQGNIDKRWTGYKSFTYTMKGDFDVLKDHVLKYKVLRDAKACLEPDIFKQKYTIDPILPLIKIDNVLTPEALQIFQDYYRENIKSGIWPLGDRQSKRYKGHNEPFSRFLHYELVPLISLIVGKPVKPTYTYLSAYVKGADLPPHTDREDCEYTVSFIIDKPAGTSWPIYVHELQQPQKYKGRYKITPPKEECQAVDCDAGGLMMFQGIDHIHFREPLDHEYYYIVLLHYRL